MHIRKVALIGIIAMLWALLVACSAVSFTSVKGVKGQSITNAEVQGDNTVVLKYPGGSACIDTNPGESQTCKPGE
ncbi:hypothetical protein [Trabulsiella odontotermitis]|uniref:Lipoprotein n=1 Tax=Trabulsiella odontotermitis TaxID=379893 RepID=A0A0L0H448_9ENTR|nr:hypothetical protein [Trabulsiella odontotermitis]KNC95744.1 hypothetical protein GM31_21770 [Trabulsiella odontotermitis]